MKKPTFFANQSKYWLIGALLLIVGVIIGRFSGRQAVTTDTVATQTSQVTPVMAVEAVKPSQITVTDNLSANGIIAAKQIAQVSGNLTGTTLTAVLVDVGDKVKKGQLLAKLDDKILTDNVAQADAELTQAQVTYQKAKADLARVEPLLSMDAISRQEVDTYRATLEQASASVLASQAKLKSAKTNLQHAQIFAPVSGVVSQKTAQVGLLVSGSPLFEIIVDGQLEWQATLSPELAKTIHIAQSAQLQTATQTITGRVTHFSPTTNNAREVLVHVLLDDSQALKAGMYQTGEFLFAKQTLPAIPVSALMREDGYDYVWTLHAKDKDIYQVKYTAVQAGSRQNDQVVVDLPADSLIVKQSGSFLSDGDLVRIAQIITNPPAQGQ